MFSSTNSGVSLPQLSPCFNLTASLGGFGDGETLLVHQDLLFHCLLESPTNKTMSSANSTIIGPEICPSNGDHCSRPFHTKSKKKDRHSKIITAQGPRDRRVRLSMDIARKFFDLQDLLGFDKASKTLDWLLTKSRTAIKELIQMKHIDGSIAKSLHSSSECENLDLIKKSTASKKKRKGNPAEKHFNNEAKALQMVAFDAVAKELRAKARARARERTKEKNFLKKLTEDKKLPYLNPSILNQARNGNHIGSCNTSDSNIHKTFSSVSINAGTKEFFCFQPNLIISTESSSNFSQWLSPNTTENWDISGTVAPSSSYNLTNTDSSRVLQISRKPFDFEEYSNNHPD